MALLNPALKDFWSEKSRNKILYGGRASSKSHDVCGRLVYIANNFKVKVLCVRQFQSKIADSVYTLLKDKINHFGVRENFNVLKTTINSKTDSEFLFYGINRNIDEIKSTEGVDILYIEEAHALTKEQWEILEPTIRKENSEVWIVFNPSLVTDFVWQRFVVNPPPDTIIRKINFNENPFLSNTMLRIIDNAKIEDEDEFNHIYLGEPKVDDEEAIIKRVWLMACIDAHKKLEIEPTGNNALGFDVADDGGDTNANVMRKGFLLTKIDEWKASEDELLKSATRTYNLARDHKAIVIYDSIGVGASMGAKFKELNKVSKKVSKKVTHIKFNAGEGVREPNRLYNKTEVLNKNMFSNLKAQTWWEFADRIRTTYNAVTKGMPYDVDNIVSISSDLPKLEQLITELSTPRKDVDNYGKVKIESKKDLKKRNISSPNIADACIMAYYKVRVKKVFKKVKPIGVQMIKS